MGKRVGAVGSLATRNRGSGNAIFPLLLFRYIIADKISAENKVPSFYGPERRVLIYAEVNSMRRRLQCRLFEIFNWSSNARVSTKAFRAINSRGHADRKEMRKFIRDRSATCVGRPLCKLFPARA